MENLPDLVVPFKREDLRAGGEGVREVREVSRDTRMLKSENAATSGRVRLDVQAQSVNASRCLADADPAP